MTLVPAQIASVITRITVAGILFDMDGVLISSITGDEQCWTYWATCQGLGSAFDVRETHGRRATDTVQKYLPGLSQDEIDEQLRELELLAERQLEGVTVYSGVENLLSSTPMERWAVVTSASLKLMRSRFSAVGLQQPLYAIGGDMLKRGKPDPEGYLRGASLLGFRSSDCLVIEDAPAGIRAGKEAGSKVLAVASSHDKEQLREADWIISSIDQRSAHFDPSSSAVMLEIHSA